MIIMMQYNNYLLLIDIIIIDWMINNDIDNKLNTRTDELNHSNHWWNCKLNDDLLMNELIDN